MLSPSPDGPSEHSARAGASLLFIWTLANSHGEVCTKLNISASPADADARLSHAEPKSPSDRAENPHSSQREEGQTTCLPSPPSCLQSRVMEGSFLFLNMQRA